MAGAPAGTVEIHSQPQPFVLTGGPEAYRDLVLWVSQHEAALDEGGAYLDEVVHPGVVTPERLPAGPNSYYAFTRMAGKVDFYITEIGHKYVAYPGNPVPFVVTVPSGSTAPIQWAMYQKTLIQSTNNYASGPQFYTSQPGNRNGPFWPSPFTLGHPSVPVAAACHGIKGITHVSMGGLCWSSQP